MQDVNEITLLKEGDVKITNLRVVIGARTYAMSNIASVRVHENEPRLFIPIFFMLMVAPCVSLIALTDIKHLSHLLTIGLYTSIATFLLFLLSRKTKYSVRIRSSVGELNIWEANDKQRAERIVRAMNQVIVNKGS